MIPKQLPLATFRWKLGDVTTDKLVLPKPFTCRAADGEELATAERVVKSAYALDPVWSGSSRYLEGVVLPGLRRCFEEDVTCIVVQHGNRIIGASGYLAEPTEDECHLVTGPCVLMEYRNRGLGSALLQVTLQELRKLGLSEAAGRTRPSSPVSGQFYAKFGGVMDAPARPLRPAQEAA
jgi:GNAT superfamily N-acetyltransferase